jgi:hypothetical protein
VSLNNIQTGKFRFIEIRCRVPRGCLQRGPQCAVDCTSDVFMFTISQVHYFFLPQNHASLRILASSRLSTVRPHGTTPRQLDGLS